MKAFTIIVMMMLLIGPMSSSAQKTPSSSKGIPIELARENKFVVKMMDVIDKSGKKITDYAELNGFNVKEKQFIFKNAKGKLKKVPARNIKKISFIRLRQGVLTGKSQKLRVIAWNGNISIFELGYQDIRMADGYMWLDQTSFSKNFKESGSLRTKSSEWSDKFYGFWQRKKSEDPNAFAEHFEYTDGKAAITRKMASEYCKSCLKIEILTILPDPETETMRFRCKDVFYDRYME